MIDREGDLLMLRSDVTLFLAKQLGTMLTEEDLPTRVYYGDTILRHQDPQDISKNEFFQSGIELVGVDGIEGELEVLRLLAALLERVGSPPYIIHLGSRALLAAVLGVSPEAVPREVANAVRMREHDELAVRAGELGLGSDRTRLLVDVAAFIGSPAELDAFIGEAASDGGTRDAMPASALAELRRLSTLCSRLAEHGLSELVRVDTSEIGTQPYHSGVAFQVYMDGFDSSLCAGGRYDGLLRSFGFDASSVGFSLMQRKLEPFLSGFGEDRSS